jgi:dUTPase
MKVIDIPFIEETGINQALYSTAQSACFDLFTDFFVTLEPGKVTKIPTGVYLSSSRSISSIEVEDVESIYLQLLSRSGLAARGVIVVGGVVDLDYTIENNPQNQIQVMLINMTPVPIIINPGDKIAQATWVRTVNALEIPTREVARVGGFGSTDKKGPDGAILQ